METNKFVVYVDGEEEDSFNYTNEKERNEAWFEACEVFKNLEKAWSGDYEKHEILIYDESYDGERLTYKELHQVTETEVDEELLNELIDEEQIDLEVHLAIEERCFA